MISILLHHTYKKLVKKYLLPIVKSACPISNSNLLKVTEFRENENAADDVTERKFFVEHKSVQFIKFSRSVLRKNPVTATKLLYREASRAKRREN